MKVIFLSLLNFLKSQKEVFNLNKKNLSLCFNAITASCAVIALSAWIYSSAENDKRSKAAQLLMTCNQNYIYNSANQSLVGIYNVKAAEEICNAFVGNYLEGSLSFEKATEIVEDRTKYLMYIDNFPEVVRWTAFFEKTFKDYPPQICSGKSCITFVDKYLKI
jgi:hypothetical protein